jgi:2-polyprenyl-3-methyl-5-hydroxy-6-metoxy-1,4-benzoquinol methylase
MPDKNLEKIYNYHNKIERGYGFAVYSEERGRFFAEKIGTGKKVLDLGCRDGILTKFYSSRNKVLGVDIDKEALKIAEENLGIRTKRIDLNDEWNLPKNYFDIVIAAELIEHLYYPEIVIKKTANVLKKDGMFLGSVPNAFNLKNRFRLFLGSKKNTPLADPTHINHFSRKEILFLLKKYFRKVNIYPLGKYSYLDKLFPGLCSYMFLFEAKK